MRKAAIAAAAVVLALVAVSGDPRHPDETLVSVLEGEIRLAIAPLFSGRAEFSTLLKDVHAEELLSRKTSLGISSPGRSPCLPTWRAGQGTSPTSPGPHRAWDRSG